MPPIIGASMTNSVMMQKFGGSVCFSYPSTGGSLRRFSLVRRLVVASRGDALTAAADRSLGALARLSAAAARSRAALARTTSCGSQELGRGHRIPEEVSLSVVDAEVGQHLECVFGLDASAIVFWPNAA